jgi:molybdate transport system substrate-binding protein
MVSRPATAMLLVAAMVGGCAAETATRTDLTVFAAASLADPLDEAATAYEAAAPGVTLRISTGSSAALATQIEQGGPADVFLSADTTQPHRLIESGLATGPPLAFARNQLSIIVPDGNPAGLTTPADLARPGVAIIAAGDAVPISQYAAELLTNLAAEAEYPADIGDLYRANVVSREDDVTAVTAKISLGEGDAGIVYATDAAGATGVETIAIPDGANVATIYAAVVVRASSNPAAAAAFLDWLTGPAGQRILGSFGFRPPAQ